MTIATSGKAVIRATQMGTIETLCLFTGAAGAVAQTKTNGGRNIVSCTETATGKYTMVFSEVGEKFMGAWFSFLGVTGVAATASVGKVVSYTAATKTMTFEVYGGATLALIDLTTAMQMFVRVLWLDSDQP